MLDGLRRVVQLQGTIIVVMMPRLLQVQLGMRLLFGVLAQRSLLGDRDGLPSQDSQQKQGRKQAAHPSKYSQGVSWLRRLAPVLRQGCDF